MGQASSNHEVRAFLRRLRALGLVIAVVVGTGTVAFSLAGAGNLWESFILALDTVATVGSIPASEKTGVEIVKVLLIVTGVGTLFYALVTVTEFFVAGHVGELLEERRTLRMIDSLSDHFIICGFGRVGRQVARDLRAAHAAFVVVDPRPENQEFASEVDVRFLEGDPGADEVLRAAGIERARGVIACVDSDADNIFICLTARGLREDVEIVARAAVEDSERKLLRAGADRVVSPYKSSGNEMARLALHPQVSGVVDVAPEYRMEEISVCPGSEGEGKTVGDVRGGSHMVAIKRSDGRFEPQPSADLVLEPGDVIMALGTVKTMDRLERLFESSA